ncbi:hypothetical protein F1880_005366 [Penicillium rolfsii]|nr:hypothetical protein F1880_005366 [Penicillium rolfsii]
MASETWAKQKVDSWLGCRAGKIEKVGGYDDSARISKRAGDNAPKQGNPRDSATLQEGRARKGVGDDDGDVKKTKRERGIG